MYALGEKVAYGGKYVKLIMAYYGSINSFKNPYDLKQFNDSKLIMFDSLKRCPCVIRHILFY